MNIRRRTNAEKLALAGRLIREVDCDERKAKLSAERKEVNAHLCKCGHTRGRHLPSVNINYTQGACKHCDCKHFLMP